MRPRPEDRRPHPVAGRIKEQSPGRGALAHVAAGDRVFPGPAKGLRGDHFPGGSGPVVLRAVPALRSACSLWQKCNRAGINYRLWLSMHLLSFSSSSNNFLTYLMLPAMALTI